MAVFHYYYHYLWARFLDLFGLFYIFIDVSSSLADYYNILVAAGLLDDRKEVTEYINKFKSARKVIKVLETGLKTLKDKNEDISGRVAKALVSLKSLDSAIQRVRGESESRPRRNPQEVEKLEEIYSDLETTLSSIKVKVDNNEKLRLTPTNFPTKLKQWIATTQTKQQLQAVEDKIKEAEQKSVELTNISTSYTVKRVEMLQLFNTSGKWPVKDKAISPPSPPQDLNVQKLGNKFKLTWSFTADNKPEYFELCYDEDKCSSMVLDGNECSTEIGFPRIDPKRIYNMKIRGINEGGSGEWSKVVVARFTKPVPRKPNPPQVYMADNSVVVVVVETPKPYCETESPVTQWNIQHIVDDDEKWKTEKYEVLPDTAKIEIRKMIQPNKSYTFQVQAVNAEGESRFSDPVSFKTEYKTIFDAVWSGITNVMNKIF